MQKLSLLLIIIFLFGCNETYVNKPFFSMGTMVEITVPKSNEADIDKIKKKIEELSSFVQSETEKVNNSTVNETIRSSEIFIQLLKKAQYFNQLSNGRFDITIHTLMKLYGFPEGPFRVPDKNELEKITPNVGFNNIIIGTTVIKKTDLTIDLGAFAKGWIVDEATKYMKDLGINNGIVNAGGDLYCLGDKDGKGWKIAIQHPDGQNKVISIVSLRNKAVATSGDYERFFVQDGKKYIHIFDATTKQPADNYRSMSVIADTVEMADGLSTVFFLMKPKEIENLCNKLNTPVLIYHLDGKIQKLCGWERFEID